MKVLEPSMLPQLPAEVVTLLQDGIYSLYEATGGNAAYVLFTEQRRQHFYVSAQGAVLSGIAETPHIGELVSLSGTSGSSVSVNFAKQALA